ncbi:DNA-processing protein DprA [Psychrobacillus psychrotolerans]|uniref:DNA-processing protein DprA n=1 Tax=Psychrobacillus psychrotolerans TaxID=126156 RepID=UPI003315667A
MIRKLLILKYLGVHGSLIDVLAKNFTEDEFIKLFNGETLELQFKYNIFKDDELDIFSNSNIVSKAGKFADNLIENSKKQNIHIISYYDEEYPTILKELDKRPLIIYAKGNIELLKASKLVACVGTRDPSFLAVNSVKNLVEGLVENGTVIVSGLAKGIDTEAHKACLHHHGKTIAVLAHGLDTIYPSENKKLANEILDNDGVLLSEYPLNTKITKRNFVARNRIVSGMSQGVIIFEAHENSGTMHTARYAFTQGKKLFCPLFTDGDKKNLSSGVLNLVESNSAYLVKDSFEIINILNAKNRNQVKEHTINNQEIMNSMKSKEVIASDKNKKSLTQDISLEIDIELYDELKMLAHQKDINVNDLISFLITEYRERKEGEERDE